MMPDRWSHSERVLLLAPIGRDAAIASAILGAGGHDGGSRQPILRGWLRRSTMERAP